VRRCPRAWCPDLHVHSMHPEVHVVQPRCPRRPCRPRPHHCACCTFSDMEHGAHGTHCRTVSMRTIVARCSRQDKSEKLRRQCPCREALALGVRVRPTGLMEPRPQGLRPWQPPPHRAHAHHPFRVASISGEKRILHAKTSAPPQRSVRAGNCRWHPTTAGPMDDCCALLLAALARAGRAGAHSSVPTPWSSEVQLLDGRAIGTKRVRHPLRGKRCVGE